MTLPRCYVKILDPMSFATSALRGIITVLGIAFVAVYAGFAAAQTGSVYAVGSVAVDETAESAATARDIALKKGQVLAYQRLLDRIVPANVRSKLSPLPEAQLLQLVSGIEVTEEKTSSVRYLAKLVVRFNPSAVRSYLRNAGIQFAETESKPLIVLPVFRSQATQQLWDASNLWLRVWRELPLSDGLINLIVPEGATADIAEISAEQAVEGNDERIKSISQRYGAAVALLTIATVKQSHGEKIVEVSTSRLDPGGADQTSVQSFVSNKEISLQEVLAGAAANLRREIEENWKLDNLIRFDDRRELLAEASLRGLPELISLQKKLEEVSLIKKAELVRLSLSAALIRLRYLGSPEQLKLALAQHDMALTQGSVYWKLQASNQ